ncbi:MAG: hypothetical protein ABEH40_09585 [Haloferacaceae archaeon]
MWVRSEYAGALAVLSAWLGAVVPWEVSLVSDVAGGNALFVRFPFAEVRYAFGLPGGRPTLVLDPIAALSFYRNTAVAVGYRVWVVGAGLVAAALVLSVAYYLREERVEAGPVDPVRLMGALLTGAGLTFAAASYLIATRGFPSLPVPVGVVLLLALGVVLLRVRRAEVGGTDDGAAE